MSRCETPRDEEPRCGARAKPDEVLEAGLESFPASDPPAWSAGREQEPVSQGGCRPPPEPVARLAEEMDWG